PPSRSDVWWACTTGWPTGGEPSGHRVVGVVGGWASQPQGEGPQGEDASRGRGGRPVVLKRRSVPPGEPCHPATVPHGSVGGRGKRRKRPRPRPTQSRPSFPLPAAAEGWRSASVNL